MSKSKKSKKEEQKEAVKAPVQVAKKKNSFLIKAFVVLVLCLLVVIGIIIFTHNAKTFELPNLNESSIFVEDGVLYNGEGQSLKMDGYSQSDKNIDATVTAVLNDKGELYVVNEKLEPIYISDKVSSFVVSYTGEGIAYLTNDNDDNNHQTLYIYDVAKDNSVKIDVDVYPHQVTLSPNGKYVAYVGNYEGRSDNNLYLAGINRGTKKIDKDGNYPVAVSDNGKNFYYVNTNDERNIKLYRYDGKKSVKIGKQVGGKIHFNRDLSEIVFNDKGKSYYYNAKLKDPVCVAEESVLGFFVTNEFHVNDFSISRFGDMYGVKSLKGKVFYTLDDHYSAKDFAVLNKDGKGSEILGKADSFGAISKDGKSVLLKEEDGIYKVSSLGDKNYKKQIYKASEKCIGLYADDKLSKAYFVDPKGALYYIKGLQKTEKLSPFISKDYIGGMVEYNQSENKIYFLENNILFAADKKADSREMKLESVSYMVKWGDGILMRDDNENKSFYAGNGKIAKLSQGNVTDEK